MDYFEPIEREILSLKDFFRNECPDSADEIVSTEKMSKDQIRYLIHFKKEMRKCGRLVVAFDAVVLTL